MKLSVAKDKVLKSLITNDKFDILGMPPSTYMAAIVELTKEGYITSVETSVAGTGMMKTYSPTALLPLGKHFYENKLTFRKKEIREWWIKAPKNYWIIGALIGLIASQSALIVKLFSKDKIEKSRIELQVKHGIKSDTIILYQK